MPPAAQPFVVREAFASQALARANPGDTIDGRDLHGRLRLAFTLYERQYAPTPLGRLSISDEGGDALALDAVPADRVNLIATLISDGIRLQQRQHVVGLCPQFADPAPRLG